MKRRGFLGALVALVAAPLAFAKKFTSTQLVAENFARLGLFEKDDVFFKAIEKKPVQVVSSRDMRIPLEVRPGGNFGHFNPEGGTLGRGTPVRLSYYE